MKIFIELDKKPKDCKNCRFCQELKGVKEMICMADNSMRRTNYHSKPEWCPVKEEE